MASNVKVSIEGNEIVIRAELAKKPEASTSGKSLILATTSGNMKTECQFNKRQIVVGLNVYVKND